MAELAFYQLRTTSLENALCTLLQKALDSHHRVRVISSSDDRISSLSLALWTQISTSFLAHGTVSDEYCHDHPILLSTGREKIIENINNADVAIALDGAKLSFLDGVSRYLDIFDGNSKIACSDARNRWVNYKAEDYQLTFWKQGEGGAWFKEK